MASPPISLASGTVLHGHSYEYEIDHVLGQGSFGITYLATVKLKGELGAIQTKTHVAIKEFCIASMATRDGTTLVYGTGDGVVDSYVRKFRREATNLSQLNHDGIVKVMESFEENGTAYFVMEYIDGPSLEQYIQHHGPLYGKIVCVIAGALCDALDYMHSNSMLHLDLKPGNVMIRRDGSVVLIDFGLSKVFDEDDTINTGTMIGSGTCGYAPIEQNAYGGITGAGGLPVTMDVYALGATIYKMLTGERPPDASMVLNEGLPDKSVALCGELAPVVVKAMNPVIKKRYRTVGELRADLGAIAYQKIPVPLHGDYGTTSSGHSGTPVPGGSEPTVLYFKNGSYCWDYIEIIYKREAVTYHLCLSETGISARVNNLCLDLAAATDSYEQLEQAVRKAVYANRSILVPLAPNEKRGERTHEIEEVTVMFAPDSEVCFSATGRVVFNQDGDGAAAGRIAAAKAVFMTPELVKAVSKAWNMSDGRCNRKIFIPDGIKCVEIRYSVTPGNTGSFISRHTVRVTENLVERSNNAYIHNSDKQEWKISTRQYRQFLKALKRMPFSVSANELPMFTGCRDMWIDVTFYDCEEGLNVVECVKLSMLSRSETVVGGNLINCTVNDVINYILVVLPRQDKRGGGILSRLSGH